MDINTLEELKKQAQSLSDSKSELSPEELSNKTMEIYSKLNEAINNLSILGQE